MSRPTKTKTLKHLKAGVVEIRFSKIDGTERVMHATLNEQLIPVIARPSAGEADYNDRNEHNECRVFDVDIQDWRAFRWDRLNYMAPKETV
jgi:hypothetical protein